MNKIKAVLVEVREDANEEPIRTSLLSKAKPTPAPKAAVAQGADGGRKETKGLPNPSSKPKAKPKATPPPKAGNQGEKGGKGGDQPKADPKGKGKGKGSEDKKDDKPKPKADPKGSGKATVPCLFWPKGTCNRGDNCPFSH